MDVAIHAQIIALLKEINNKSNTAILFISHDLSIVEKLCDRVMVMFDGTVVEEGTCNEIFKAPKDDYTKRLLNAIPHL